MPRRCPAWSSCSGPRRNRVAPGAREARPAWPRGSPRRERARLGRRGGTVAAREHVHQRITDHHAACHAGRRGQSRAEKARARPLKHAGLIPWRVLRGRRRGRGAPLLLRSGGLIPLWRRCGRAGLLAAAEQPAQKPRGCDDCCCCCACASWAALFVWSSSHSRRLMRFCASASACSCTKAVCVSR